MQKKIANFLFSTRLTAVLFVIFPVAMATGTILDRNMGTSPTPFTRTLIYNAWWFELVMLLMMVNFIGNIKKYDLLQRKKFSVLMYHLSFVLIILGAGITRYTSFEGVMRVREGESSNIMISDKNYIQLIAQKNGDSLALKKEMYITVFC